MSWLLLIVGGFFEAGFTFCIGMMRGATGWSWTGWLLAFLACATMSMGLLVKATETLPIGTAYPVWTGIGAVSSVIVGILVFGESVSAWRLFFIFTLIASIVGLKMVS